MASAALGVGPAEPQRAARLPIHGQLLEQLASQYDVVLIDTPPLLPVTDAAILATITGGALIVAEADLLHRQQLADGLRSLQDVGARVLGMVLTRLAHQQGNTNSYNDCAAAGPGMRVSARWQARTCDEEERMDDHNTPADLRTGDLRAQSGSR